MASASSVMTGIVCPLLGTTLCNVMWFVSLPAVLEARSKKNIGNLNVYVFGKAIGIMFSNNFLSIIIIY
jgi:hypothetical protein